jgi:hypothetical protein
MTRSAALLCMLLLAACAHATAPQAMSAHEAGIALDETALDETGLHDIALPRMPAAGQRVLLEVALGAIGSGSEVVLRTPDGLLIGTVSPHGIRPGNAAGTYVVPVPPKALRRMRQDGRLRLRIRIERAGAAARPVRADEVRSLRAVLVD